MNKGLKVGLIIGGIAVAGVGVYFAIKKFGGNNHVIPEDAPDTRGGKVTDNTCRENPKSRMALNKGLYIPPNHVKRFPEQSDCSLLGWMYELKYQSGKSWAGNYSIDKLVETAEWQWDKWRRENQ